MREKFKSFYELTEDDLSKIWTNKETVFIFDTNILLNLYHYSQETQDEFFKILDVVKDRIWIPFHVALEYQRRRLEIIRSEKAVFSDINKKLDAIKKIIDNDFSEFNLKARNTNLFDIEEKFKKDIGLLIDSFKKEVNKVDKDQPCVRTYDDIRAKLDDLLEGKVGEEPEEKWVLQVAKNGEERYKNKIPPGYEDVNKDKDPNNANFIFNNVKYERKFGDLIIWRQIIEHLEKLDSIQNVIFITDDSKEDWWEIIQSRGKKKIGARPELKSEIYKDAGIENFKMYHTNDFLTAAKKYSGISVNDKAIKETEFLFNSWESKNIMKEALAKYKAESDTATPFQKMLDSMKIQSPEVISFQEALANYKAESDTTTLFQKMLDSMKIQAPEVISFQETLANYKAESDTVTSFQKALDSMRIQSTDATALQEALAKYRTESDTATSLQKALDNLKKK